MAKATTAWKLQRPPIDRLPVELLRHVFILATHGLDGVAGDEKETMGVSSTDRSSQVASGVLAPSPACAAWLPDDNSDLPPPKTYPPLDVSPHSATCPRIFSSVCRRWRHVAVAEPRLWTTIVATADDVLDGVPDMRGIRMFVERSRSAPLDILLDLRNPDWDFCDPCPSDSLHTIHVRAALSLLLPHCRRWRSFALLTDTYTPIHSALSLLSSFRQAAADTILKPSAPSSAPLLESLVFMRCNEYACHTTEFHPYHLKHSSFLPFGGAYLPRLRNLQLLGTHVAWSALPNLMSPSAGIGLRTLELSYNHLSVCPSATELQAILNACPDLCSLTIKLSIPEDDTSSGDDDSPPTRINLPALTDLSITYGSVSDAASFLLSLHAPAVTRLELEDGGHPAETETEDASLLLHALAGSSPAPAPARTTGDRSLFPAVRQLTLRGVQARQRAFASFYYSLPVLRDLEVDEATPAAVLALCPPPKGEAPCLRLRRLRVIALPEAIVPAYEVVGVRAAAGCRVADVYVVPAECDAEPDVSDAFLSEADADAMAAILGDSEVGDGWDDLSAGDDVDEPATPEHVVEDGSMTSLGLPSWAVGFDGSQGVLDLWTMKTPLVMHPLRAFEAGQLG